MTAIAQWNEMASLDPEVTLLLDVRRPDERARGFIPGSTHIPLDELRECLSELPREREIIAYCQSGQRFYIAVSKNGPCWVDIVAFMTGARVNLQTLRIDNSVGDGFIIQKVSTGETYSVHLKPGVFPEPQAALEGRVRAARAQGQSVSAGEIDEAEDLANALSRRLLNARAADVLDVHRLEGYRFLPNDFFGARGDIINKDMPRTP